MWCYVSASRKSSRLFFPTCFVEKVLRVPTVLRNEILSVDRLQLALVTKLSGGQGALSFKVFSVFGQFWNFVVHIPTWFVSFLVVLQKTEKQKTKHVDVERKIGGNDSFIRLFALYCQCSVSMLSSSMSCVASHSTEYSGTPHKYSAPDSVWYNNSPCCAIDNTNVRIACLRSLTTGSSNYQFSYTKTCMLWYSHCGIVVSCSKALFYERTNPAWVSGSLNRKRPVLKFIAGINKRA